MYVYERGLQKFIEISLLNKKACISLKNSQYKNKLVFELRFPRFLRYSDFLDLLYKLL